MKNVKIALGSLLLVAILTAFSVNPTTPAPTAKPTEKFTTCWFYKYNNVFIFTTPPGSTTPLGNSANYDAPTTVFIIGDLCPGGIRACGAVVCTDVPNAPALTEAQLATEIKKEADRLGGTLTHGYSWNVTIGGITYTITWYRKATA